MDEQARWMARLLETSLQRSGLSEREAEERLGWEPGTLAPMLDGVTECEPLQLLAILAEIGSDRPESFLLPQRRDIGMVQELLARFRGLGYGQPGAASDAAIPPAPDEIEKTVEDVLQRTFGSDFGKEKRGGR